MKLLLVALKIALLSGCAHMQNWFENEQDVAMADVPEIVLSAAREAVPGIELLSAEIETEDGRSWYEFDGVLDGKEYEIEVDKAGNLLSIDD